MSDQAHHFVSMHKHLRELEELLAYMDPTPDKRERIQWLAGDIAYRALAIKHKYERRT